MFAQTKSPFKSLGVLGGGGGIAAGLGMLGINVTGDDVVQAKDLALSLATTIAGIVALYGRVRATSRISLGD